MSNADVDLANEIRFKFKRRRRHQADASSFLAARGTKKCVAIFTSNLTGTSLL